VTFIDNESSLETVNLLAVLLERVEIMNGQLERFNALLTEFEPVIRAYLDPAASGPVAWAVRRQVTKGKLK
jgi:hypothetical protein